MTSFQKILLVVIIILEWFALIAQLHINMHHGIGSTVELIVRYFSYFTILTNLLVAVLTTSLLIKIDFRLKRFFKKQSTQTATVVYIFIVGLIYNIILRSAWNPQGLQKPVDELLHLVNPVLFIIYWASFSNRKILKWKNILFWLIYPFVYLVLVLMRARSSDFYPYPFLDVNKLGLEKVFINCISITILFALTSIIFLAIGNYIAKGKPKLYA
jgi:hypothetical protein